MSIRFSQFPALGLFDNELNNLRNFGSSRASKRDRDLDLWDPFHLTNAPMDDAQRQKKLRDHNLPTGMRVDVVERKNDYQVIADLPGCDMNDVDIEVKDGMLHISASRQQRHEERNDYSHHIERAYGLLKRSVAIPTSAIADAAEASFDNGVLTIQFAKHPDAITSPKKLEVKAGSWRAKELEAEDETAIAAKVEKNQEEEQETQEEGTEITKKSTNNHGENKSGRK
jgi:HSP20 family molecular chaperone IbpA